MTEALQRWEWAARATLADHGIGYHAASEVLAHVRAYCLSTGDCALDAFGPPCRWAAAAASMPLQAVRR